MQWSEERSGAARKRQSSCPASISLRKPDTMPATKTKPGGAEAILDKLGIEALCDLIADGKSQRTVCQEINVERGSLRRWLALDPERQRLFDMARVEAAEGFVDMAEQELRTAKPTKIALARARELASHYRWKASKANVQRYGDKVAVGGARDMPPINHSLKVEFVGRAPGVNPDS